MALQPVGRPKPGATYFVLASEAGYSAERGLTGSGNEGTATPKRKTKSWDKGQTEEDGKRQTFQEHAQGAYEEAQRIAKLYRPFLEAFANTLPTAADKGTTPEDIADTLQAALEMAALLHDVGKLNAEWQAAIRLPGMTGVMARTTDADREQLKAENRPRPPYHAQYVYPFLKSLLCNLAGEYRMFDHLALAAARHHTLTLDGDIEKGAFAWADGGKEELREVLNSAFPGLVSEDDFNAACNALNGATLATEVPGPSSASYFLYCLTNRLVIQADRCDAGQKQLELAETTKGDANE